VVGQQAGSVGARRAARGRGRALWRWHERKKEEGDGASRRGHWRRCAARGWWMPQLVQEQWGAVVEQQIGGRWCRRAALGRSLRQGLEKLGRRNIRGAERRTAKCVDLHGHDHEERGDEGPVVAGHRTPRRMINPLPRTGHPPEHREMGAAVEQAKGKGGGGGGVQRPHLACMQARAGRNYTSSSLLATSADTVESAVSTRLYDVGRLSVQPPAQRAPHGEVPISPQMHPRPRMEPALGRGSAQ